MLDTVHVASALEWMFAPQGRSHVAVPRQVRELDAMVDQGSVISIGQGLDQPSRNAVSVAAVALAFRAAKAHF